MFLSKIAITAIQNVETTMMVDHHGIELLVHLKDVANGKADGLISDSDIYHHLQQR